MPSLANHQSNQFTKLLLIGDAKSGKTGSLVSLVKAGYKLRILDFDNLLDILKFKVMEECPDKLDNVSSSRSATPIKPEPLGAKSMESQKHGSMLLNFLTVGNTKIQTWVDLPTGDPIVSLSSTVYLVFAMPRTTSMNQSSPEESLEIMMDEQFMETLKTMLKRSWLCSLHEASPPT